MESTVIAVVAIIVVVVVGYALFKNKGSTKTSYKRDNNDKNIQE